MTARFIVGDSLTVLRSLPDASVDLVLSSPAFLALRSYLPADDPLKKFEMGSEPTPGAFIDALLNVTEECRRVLAPHGSLCFELGDTYAGSGGAGGDYNADGWKANAPAFTGSAKARRNAGDYPNRDDIPRPPRSGRSRADGNGQVFRGGQRMEDHRGDGWPLDKSLCLIPELFRVSLVYGFNPLTGRQTPRWRARNVVRWCRPNPPVGALADKVRPATSDMVVACTSAKRWFDLDAVRHVGVEPGAVKTHSSAQHNPSVGWCSNNTKIVQNPNGAPPLDHWWHDDVFEQDAWLISTQPYRGSHYATWPADLCVKPIEAMCPRRVCLVCGEPSRRLVDSDRTVAYPAKASNGARITGGDFGQEGHTERQTVGWTDCGCPGEDRWRAGVVLDPFCGSGTTLAVATGHGRDAIGIDLDVRNYDLARERVGMLLELAS